MDGLRPTVYMLRGVTLVYLLKNADKFLDCSFANTRVKQKLSRQPSAVSRQPSAVSRQPSAVSRQPSAVSRQYPRSRSTRLSKGCSFRRRR